MIRSPDTRKVTHKQSLFGGLCYANYAVIIYLFYSGQCCSGSGLLPKFPIGNIMKASASNYQVELREKFDCNTENIIYCIECKVPRCKHIQYIGKTSDPLKVRFGSHHSNVNLQKDQAISNHFNSPGHSISDMTITIIEKIYNKIPLFLREREKFYMTKFNTRLGALNLNS